jgi:putative FmdB family regulatory protein
MPIFDFECLRCGETHEQLVLGGESIACPNCGCNDLKKLIGLPAPVAKSPGMISRARQKAEAAGHLSNYSSRERSRK